jgi:hypothetical protein
LTLSRIEQLRAQQQTAGEAQDDGFRQRTTRCDVLCMVVNINDQDRPPRLAVWDGTNPGSLRLQDTEEYAENVAPEYVYSTIQAARHYSSRDDEYVHTGHVHDSLLGSASTVVVREHWQSIRELAIGECDFAAKRREGLIHKLTSGAFALCDDRRNVGHVPELVHRKLDQRTWSGW